MTKRFLIFLAAALFLMAGIASATTLGPITTSTPISATLTDWTGTLAFQQFNPALGTLNSVQLSLSGDMNTVLTVTNNSPDSNSSGHAQTHLVITVQDLGSYLNAPEIDLSYPSSGSPFNYVLDHGQSTTSGNLTKHYTYSSELYTLAAILSEFKGTGNIVLDANTFTETALYNTGGNTESSQVTKASLTGTVTYDYNPIPEPATIGLLSLGGLTLFRKKKHR